VVGAKPHGTAGAGAVVGAKPHGTAGAGAVVGAIIHDGAFTVTPPSKDVAMFLKPIAAVNTTKTNTTSISHLFIDPSRVRLQPGGVYKRPLAVKRKILEVCV
jgi:hypothetical protein